MFDFSRRINGPTYYSGIAICLAGLIIFALLGETPDLGFMNYIVGIVMLILILLVFTYWVCLIRQRANDISGKHPLLVTILGLSPLFVLLGLMPGERTKSKYGKVPLRGVHLA